MAVRAPGATSAPPGNLERLVNSNHTVTLGGQSFGGATTTGQLAGPTRTTSITPRNGAYVTSLPPASAALLTL